MYGAPKGSWRKIILCARDSILCERESILLISRSHKKVTGAPSRKWSTEETTVSLQTVIFMWRNGSAYII